MITKDVIKTVLKVGLITRKELSDVVGMTYSTFSQKLNGYSNFSDDELDKIGQIIVPLYQRFISDLKTDK